MNARAMRRLELGLASDPYIIASATFQADIGYHNRILGLGRSTGIAINLPAAKGSGTFIRFVVTTVCTTSPYYVISTKPTTDIYQGGIVVGIDNSATGKSFKTASNSNTLTMNGTTQGGVTIGDMIWVIDIASGVWAVGGSVIGSGAIATQFSNV